MSDNKVSSEVFKACVDKYSQSKDPVKVMWHDIEVEIKPMLSYTNVLLFIDGVVSSCFLDEDNTYVPEVKDFAINSFIISYYTNIELPEDVAEQYDYVMRSDIYGVIFDTIDGIQFEQIIGAIDEKIRHIADSNIQALQKEVFELYGAIDNMSAQFENTFLGLSGEDMSKLWSSIIDGKFDEAKLVDAYFDKKKVM